MRFQRVLYAAWQLLDEREKPLNARNLRMGLIFAPLWKRSFRNADKPTQFGGEPFRRAGRYLQTAIRERDCCRKTSI